MVGNRPSTSIAGTSARLENVSAAALEITLFKRTYVLPWNQFLYAEGGDDEVRAVFATHDVIIKGAGLTALLTDLAAQNVTVVQEPSRSYRFQTGADRLIREVIVQKVEAG